MSSGTGPGTSVAESFAALADPQRLALLERLSEHRPPGGATATTLAAPLPITRQAVVAQLKVLQSAGLVRSHRVGREVRYDVSAAGLARPTEWLERHRSAWGRRLDDLRERAESS